MAPPSCSGTPSEPSSGSAPSHPQPPLAKLWIQVDMPSCDPGWKDWLKSKTKKCSWKWIDNNLKYQTSALKLEIYELKPNEFIPAHTQYTPHPNPHTSNLTPRSDVSNLGPHKADPQKTNFNFNPKPTSAHAEQYMQYHIQALQTLKPKPSHSKAHSVHLTPDTSKLTTHR